MSAHPFSDRVFLALLATMESTDSLVFLAHPAPLAPLALAE